jgi:hypothetical protein
MEALQTHGRYKETWHPPKDRFVFYERSDEAWMRPLGLGVIKKSLLPLFDVRLESTFDLVGYIGQNPVECHYGSMRFSVLRPARFDFFDVKCSPDNVDYKTIELRVSKCTIHSRRYLSWSVCQSDVAELVLSNILTHGPDNKEQFLYEIRRRMASQDNYFAKQH